MSRIALGKHVVHNRLKPVAIEVVAVTFKVVKEVEYRHRRLIDVERLNGRIGHRHDPVHVIATTEWTVTQHVKRYRAGKRQARTDD